MAIRADGWQQALLRSVRQDPLTGLANRSPLFGTGRAARAVGERCSSSTSTGSRRSTTAAGTR
ncbi:hypothetical protein [Geodermatophilus sp. SYSU D00766]